MLNNQRVTGHMTITHLKWDAQPKGGWHPGEDPQIHQAPSEVSQNWGNMGETNNVWFTYVYCICLCFT